MNAETDDTGFTITQLWAIAWVLALIGIGAAIKSSTLLDGAKSLDRPLGLWAGLALLGIVWSSACAVIAAVKAADERVRALMASVDIEEPD